MLLSVEHVLYQGITTAIFHFRESDLCFSESEERNNKNEEVVVMQGVVRGSR